MNRSATYFFAAIAVVLAACSGNFATGTGVPNTIPQVNGSQAPIGPNGMPQGGPSPQVSGSPGVTASTSYTISDAQTGFKCPDTIDGYACLLRFNVPAEKPSPSPGPRTKSKGKAAATPSPSPTPTPTPSPAPSGSEVPASTSSPSAAPNASASPSSATVALKAEAMPKDAPQMYHTPANTLDVVPLLMVHLTPAADFVLDGNVVAQFTLPKEQIAQRGFAVQLFQATARKKRTDYKPIWTFDKSTLKDNTLTFGFKPPKMTIPKAATYVVVLYGDDTSKTSPVPSTVPSAAPMPTATATAAASSSPSP